MHVLSCIVVTDCHLLELYFQSFDFSPECLLLLFEQLLADVARRGPKVQNTIRLILDLFDAQLVSHLLMILVALDVVNQEIVRMRWGHHFFGCVLSLLRVHGLGLSLVGGSLHCRGLVLLVIRFSLFGWFWRRVGNICCNLALVVGVLWICHFINFFLFWYCRDGAFKRAFTQNALAKPAIVKLEIFPLKSVQ